MNRSIRSCHGSSLELKPTSIHHESGEDIILDYFVVSQTGIQYNAVCTAVLC
jgi:hypothetical protein